jgi:hypothetical protein
VQLQRGRKLNLVGLSDGIATTAQTDVDALRACPGRPG